MNRGGSILTEGGVVEGDGRPNQAITEATNAQKPDGRASRWERRPRYARQLIWDDSTDVHDATLAISTALMPPLPRPPQNELQNTVALHTIQNHPHLFKIVTPIKINRLEELLSTHPNRPLVDSVIVGFREGFWPWAITDNMPRPVTWDNADRPLREEVHELFAREQRDMEVDLERFSTSFGPDLLPGMFGVPCGVVPKPHSDKLRLVVDQSAEPYSLNSMIPRSAASVHLDNLVDLGRILRAARKKHGRHVRFIIFKSDVSQAYRRLPMHFLWQIRQAFLIGGTRHIDRCNNFGNRAGGWLFGYFMGVVLWIAIFVRHIEDLLAYVDDVFSWDMEGNMQFYQPYNKLMPAKQVQLLELWDELGVPHEEHKQLCGTSLTIIGFDVDPNAMTITLPAQSRSDLVDAILAFAVPGVRHTLREFQRLSGWMNWSLNVYPLLRPGLSELSHTMSQKTESQQPISVSDTLCRELQWFAHRIAHSDGIHLIDSVEWGLEDADLVLLTDACRDGMGFWSPDGLLGFQALVSDWENTDIVQTESDPRIFFFEALAVVSAIVWAAEAARTRPRRLAIRTDNTNTVDMFNSLKAKPQYNPLLITAVNALIEHDIQLRVFHIPGDDNSVADALSRFDNGKAMNLAPGISVQPFRPPQLAPLVPCTLLNINIKISRRLIPTSSGPPDLLSIDNTNNEQIMTTEFQDAVTELETTINLRKTIRRSEGSTGYKNIDDEMKDLLIVKLEAERAILQRENELLRQKLEETKAGGWRVEKHPLIVADLTGDKKADIVVFGESGVWTTSNNGSGSLKGANLAIRDFAYAQGWRVDKHYRALADVTGNGLLDIIGFGEKHVFVSLNNGNGTFRPLKPVIDGLCIGAGGWEVDKHPRAVVDLTGDGKADILGFGNEGVTVSLNNGDGSFGTATKVLDGFAWNQGWRMDKHLRFLADVTGNGLVDIIGFGDEHVLVSQNNGNGTFQPMKPVIHGLYTGASGWQVDKHPRVVADLTGDGRADILGFGDTQVLVSFNNGNGTFRPMTTILSDCFTPAQGWRVDMHPRITADLTGNKRGDIIGFGNAGVLVSFNNGDGTFQPSKRVVDDFGYDAGWRVKEHPRFVADLTGDGCGDIIGIKEGAVWVAYNDGKGNFGPVQKLTDSLLYS